MHKRNRIPAITEYLKRPAYSLRQTGGCGVTARRQDDSVQPLVSVITIVKNRKQSLPQTINSVLSQTYQNIEYIIVDGASTDGTLEVIKQFDDRIAFWVSEPDDCGGDAANKGINLAKGDFIFLLASDDWIDPGFIETAIKSILNSGADFVFGNMAMYRRGDLVSWVYAKKDYVKSLVSGDPRFNSACMLIRKECFKKFGLFDLFYKHTSDYEWILRCCRGGKRGHYDNSLTVHRRTGGFGEKYLLKSTLEQLSILKQYRLPMDKAINIYLGSIARRTLGYCAKLFLPGNIHKKLKCIIYGRRL